MKYLFLFLLLTTTAHAASGTYEACAGFNCRKLGMEFYNASQIKSMHPEHFCDVYLKAPPMVKGQLPLRHVFILEKDCRHVYNMSDAMVYNFVNPSLTENK